MKCLCEIQKQHVILKDHADKQDNINTYKQQVANLNFGSFFTVFQKKSIKFHAK